MANLFVILIVLVIVFAVSAYIIREKRRGTVCIGCPAGGQCSRANCAGGCSSCHTDPAQTEQKDKE